MSRKSPLRMSILAAGALLAASASSYAGEALEIELPSMRTPITPSTQIAPLAADHEVYAGGEAMPPEVEARVRQRMMSQGHGRSTAEVRQELAEARRAGTLSAPGEIADTTQILHARAEFNVQQTREILASHERERQLLAALQAPAVAAAEPATSASTSEVEPTEQTLAATPQADAAEPGSGNTAVEPVEASTEGPAPEPAAPPAEQAPEDPAVLRSQEIPINRVEDLADETMIDTD